MLTLVEAISLAGDRAKQNDDAHGVANGRAWVIDGATDLHGEPIMPFASDAAWLAQHLNGYLYKWPPQKSEEFWMRAMLRQAADAVGIDFIETELSQRTRPPMPVQPPPSQAGSIISAWGDMDDLPAWKSPTASVLFVTELTDGILGLDLGDCRCFALDATSVAHAIGGPPKAADREAQHAADATKKAGETPLLQHAESLAWLRDKRAQHNTAEGYWVFGLQSKCAEHARAWTLDLARAAHILLCTDGFSALVDRYDAYDAPGLVRAAMDQGLHALGAELRAIEAADSSAALHPRWKRSDDATAVLLRLT